MEANNTKAMREALKEIHDRVNSLDEECGVDPIEIRDIARTALAAPPRNCDRFKTKEEAATAFAKEKNLWIPQHILWDLAPWLDWLFATATEQKGANDGSK